MYQTKKLLPIFLLQVLLLYSCTTTKVISKYDCNTIANNPINKKTTWSFLWGLMQPKDINPNCEAAFNHLNKVEVKTNLGYALITVGSLGIVMPQQVQWCCAPQNPDTDTLGTAKRR